MAPPLRETVATAGTGVGELWAALKADQAHLESSGELGARELWVKTNKNGHF